MDIKYIRKSNKLIKELEAKGFFTFYNFKNNRTEIATHVAGSIISTVVGYINKDLEVIKY